MKWKQKFKIGRNKYNLAKKYKQTTIPLWSSISDSTCSMEFLFVALLISNLSFLPNSKLSASF